jgi:TPP-dependent pyruvate/acetoin dehydrogenase alpha subunit
MLDCRNSRPIGSCLLIRRFEEKAGQLYGMGLIGGFCHLYIGQEAVVVGMQHGVEGWRPDDHWLS